LNAFLPLSNVTVADCHALKLTLLVFLMFRLHLRPKQSQGGEGSEETAWWPCPEDTGSKRRHQDNCSTALGGHNRKCWRWHTNGRAIKGELSHLYNTTFLQLDDS